MDVDQADTRIISYCGKIIETTLVTNNPSVADKWVQNIIHKYHNQKIIAGFDCKYTTSQPIRSMNQQISTLQICIGPSCLVLKLSHLKSIPESVKVFLTNPNLCLFGVEVHDNVMKLERCYEVKCCCGKVVDIRALVKVMFPLSGHCRCWGKVSLRGIAYKVAGFSARQRKKNAYGCDEEELVESASVDAYACFCIAHNLLH